VAAGKYEWQSLVAASNCNNSAIRLYVTDQHTKMSLLVNTGTDPCAYDHSCLRERRTQTNYEFFAVNGAIVRTYG
jgi:hypothetical protein